jgi:DNA repair exonuclease SbcCD ATPase subunit
MITFNTIKWKNFLSTGNAFTEINLNSHRTSLIVGNNGAGKSTILDALCFALYGKPFRKINKPQLLNSINGKECVVEIEFSAHNKTFKVVRGIKPNIFKIFQNGEVINQHADMKDYQEYLEKQVLKMNFKSFSQIVILGSASFVPFMQLSAANRREIIEDLLDIQIFTTMNILLKEKLSLHKEHLTSLEYKIKNLEDQIEIEKRHNDDIKESKDASISQKQKQIGDLLADNQLLSTKVQELIDQVNQYNQQLTQETEAEDKLDKYDKMHRTCITKYTHLKKELTFFEEHDQCPSCKQPILSAYKDTILENDREQLKQYAEAKQKLEQKKAKVEQLIDSFAALHKKINHLQQQIADYNNKSTLNNRMIDMINKDIESLKVNEDHHQKNQKTIKALQIQLRSVGNEREDAGEHKRMLDLAATLLRDGGIKTKIIKQYVPIINQLINKYLTSMDFFVNFELDENFNETIKSRFRDDFSYESFSEGEKSRLDLALLFTWRAIAKMRNSASTNLLILDEVFDGSLDGTGNDELLKILDSLSHGNNVFVISHRTDAMLDKFERVLKFEKHKNFSRIVEA